MKRHYLLMNSDGRGSGSKPSSSWRRGGRRCSGDSGKARAGIVPTSTASGLSYVLTQPTSNTSEKVHCISERHTKL